MKRRVFLGLALAATLAGSAGRSSAEERKPLDAPGPLVVAPEEARQQQAEQQLPDAQVELWRELLAAQQARQTRRIAALALQTALASRVLQLDPYAGCKIRVVEPDPNVDYKIVMVRPDPNVDYKIRNAYPGGQRVHAVPRNDRGKTIIIHPKPGEGAK